MERLAPPSGGAAAISDQFLFQTTRRMKHRDGITKIPIDLVDNYRTRMSADFDSKCFVISPIGEEGSETRERADQVLEHVIKPALEPYEYYATRADDIAEPGIITNQIIEHVVECPLVIADLTGSNPNVFYELAVRHAYQKPIIQLCREREKIPFDLAGTRTIEVEISNLETASRAKEEISEQIDNILEGDPDVDTPISAALQLKELRESDNPEEQSMAEILESISELRNSVASIRNLLDNSDRKAVQDISGRLTVEEIHRRRSLLHNFLNEYQQNKSELESIILDLEGTEGIEKDKLIYLLERIDRAVDELRMDLLSAADKNLSSQNHPD